MNKKTAIAIDVTATILLSVATVYLLITISAAFTFIFADRMPVPTSSRWFMPWFYLIFEILPGLLTGLMIGLITGAATCTRWKHLGLAPTALASLFLLINVTFSQYGNQFWQAITPYHFVAIAGYLLMTVSGWLVSKEIIERRRRPTIASTVREARSGTAMYDQPQGGTPRQ